MRRSSIEKKCILIPWLFSYCILFICSFDFVSCKSPSNPQSTSSTPKKSQVTNHINQDSFVAPKVVFITETNKPKVVMAGKPIVRVDSSNGGASFFTSYGTEQGISMGALTSGIIDSSGNFWFGLRGGGVSRYDGKSFINFTTAQGLAGNRIECIIQDKSGDIWLGAYGGGVSKYDGKRFTNYTVAQGLVGNQVWSMMNDESGMLWFGTDKGICIYDGKSFKSFNKAQDLVGNIVRSIFQDSKGNIWFGTTGRGVVKYDSKDFTTYDTSRGLAGMQVRHIIEDKSGNIWFATNGGVSKYDGKNFSNYSTSKGLASDDVLCMLQDKFGKLWFGTAHGVSRLDSLNFTNYTTKEGLIGDRIYCILQDKSGDVWFGIGGGISRYIGNSITYYTAVQGLVGGDVRAIIQDKSDNLWIGTYEGISKFDGKSFANYTVTQGLPANEVSCIMQDKAGNLWFGGNDITMFDGKKFTIYTTSQGLVANGVWCIKQVKSGDIWIGTNGGASKYDGKSFTNYTTDQGLLDNFVVNIIEDKSGYIWFGTHGGGVSRYDGKRFSNFTTAQGLANNVVRSIVQDKFGNIWFGTDGEGVSKFDNGRFINLSTSQGMGDNIIYAIAEDSMRNILWLGTNLGISGLRIDSLAKKYVFEIFNKNTGYPIKDLNTNALYVDRKGILWCGAGDSKLIRFDFAKIKKSSIPLRLVIQRVKVNNEDICWNNLNSKLQEGRPKDSLAMINEIITSLGKNLSKAELDSMRVKFSGIEFDSVDKFYPVPINLTLPYEDNNVIIDFAAIELDLPKLVKYQYKLDGYNKEWSPRSNGTTAAFGNIPEGSYTFRVKCLSPYGAWSEINYTFRILPPWYRTWWAYSLYGLCLFLGIFCTDRIRRNVVVKRERAKTRERELAQAKEIEKAYYELKITQAQLIQSEKMASLGELTAGIAHEIQNPLNFVNNFSDVNTELIEEVGEEIEKGNINDAKEILNDIKENEKKINHHGKRADAIVKGMLQHSRSSAGQKEPFNINALADECLKLSYHSIRAKDKSFQADLKTDFDESIEKISVIQQDIVRVLINLFNNAFYAVNEKYKQNIEGYEPAVSLTTKKINNNVELTIMDNGNGIPQKIIDKIFQPFFTTKPTGQGTGLGLSLSYDIVKAHGGALKVGTKEGEYAEFIIQLPLSGKE